MTRIDFYILESNTDEARLNFSCRLIEKAVNQGNCVLANTESEQACEELDDLLWSFKPEAYVPHGILGNIDENELAEIPVVISHNTDCESHHDVLVNLGLEIPPYFAKFKRFAHIVNQDEKRLTASRKCFAFFRDRGYPIEVNKLKL